MSISLHGHNLTIVLRHKRAGWLFLFSVAIAALFISSLRSHRVDAAGNLSPLSDLISTSAPAIGTDHTFTFYTRQIIPSGGKIIITPEPNRFTIPSDLSATNISIGTGSSFNGSFVDRAMTTAASPTAFEDAVIVASGTSGSVNILLATGGGMSIPADTFVQIKIGSSATLSGNDVWQIINPSSTGSYRLRLEVRDSGNATISNGTAMIAIVDPVGTLTGTNDFFPPTITNGLPAGTIPGSATNIEMSVNTDARSTCRYTTVASTSYSAMPYTLSTMDQYFHWVFMTTTPATSYSFFVRCQSRGGITNLSDYPITFTVAPTSGPPYSGPGVPGVPPGGGGFGQPYPASPSIPNMSLSGFGSPATTLTVLKDGTSVATGIVPDSVGAFRAALTIATQGNTTVAVYATDPGGIKSAPYSINVTAVSGIQTAVSGAVIPPTLAGPADNNIKLGAAINLSGYAPPLSSIEFFLTQSGRRPGNVPSSRTQTNATGKFSYSVKTNNLPKGQYEIRARAILNSATSPFSTPYPIGLGVTAKAVCKNPTDINNDNKVNLVDFSMFLFDLNKSALRSDFNCDNKVSLTDFSILLFSWTG